MGCSYQTRTRSVQAGIPLRSHAAKTPKRIANKTAIRKDRIWSIAGNVTFVVRIDGGVLVAAEVSRFPVSAINVQRPNKMDIRKKNQDKITS